MKRLLIASSALAATLSVAGLALAQTSSAPSAAPTMPNASGSNAAGPATSMSPTSPSSPSMNQAAPAPNSTMSGNHPAIQASTSPTTVRKAQETLQAQGLYQGPVDGKMGEKTQTAISQYQRKAGLPQTAMLDEQTLEHLLTGWSSASGTRPSGATGTSPSSAMGTGPSTATGTSAPPSRRY